MTDKKFCKLYSQFYGEKIDHIKQLTLITFDGDELKEFVKHCIRRSVPTEDNGFGALIDMGFTDKETAILRKLNNECKISVEPPFPEEILISHNI